MSYDSYFIKILSYPNRINLIRELRNWLENRTPYFSRHFKEMNFLEARNYLETLEQEGRKFSDIETSSLVRTLTECGVNFTCEGIGMESPSNLICRISHPCTG